MSATPQQIASIARLTENQLKAEYWIGNKTGHLFRVIRVEGSGSCRNITYCSPGEQETFTKSLDQFASRFHQADRDEIFAILSPLIQPPGDDEVVGILVEPDQRHDFSRIILHPETREAFRTGINRIINRDKMEEVWGLSAVEPLANRCIINAYGPPGTGKTLGCYCLARQLEQKVYQVDYSAIISKQLGDTAKHIVAAFAAAKKAGAILLFDEADSLLSRRVEIAVSTSFATSINQNRNVFMQELDRYDGAVYMTTNMFENYDPAMLRRIARHIPFELPNADMRQQLFAWHLPRLDRVTIQNWRQICEQTEGFSGGDIKNVVMNSIDRASMSEDSATWFLTEEIVLAEVSAVRTAKSRHGGKNGVATIKAPTL